MRDLFRKLSPRALDYTSSHYFRTEIQGDRHGVSGLGQPRRHRRLRVHRIHGARSRRARQAVRADGLHGDRASPAQERDAVSAGRDQLHHQRRARFVRATLRASARAVDLRDRVPRRRCRPGLQARARTRRVGFRQQDRPDGTEHPGDQGRRRFADLFRRPLARQERRAARQHRRHQHLRRRLRTDSGRRSESGRPRPDLHRSPDAQRASRSHDRMGRVLRAPVQLPRSALLRYRRQGDRR